MVEWKKLEDICTRITDGSHFSPKAVEQGYYMPSVKDMTSSGFDFSSCKQISEVDYMNLVKNGCKPNIGDVLVAKDGSMLKYVFPVNKEEDIVVLSSIALLTPKQDILNSAYLLYYLLRSDIKERTIRELSSKGGVPRIILKNFKKIQIPIPSLSEQQRIVGILDTFTASIDNLKEQIAQRRKQYEYYRDQLLDLEGKEGVEVKKLKDACEIRRGIRVVKKQLKDNALYPVFQNSIAPMGYYDQFNRDGNMLYIICAGSSSGSVGYCITPFWAADDCFTIESGKINRRYIYYALKKNNNNLFKLVRKGSMPRLPHEAIDNMVIPIPSLSEQSRIVSILDTFESSITNLESQLSQREKQYEYYRNKLLTFE